MRKNRMKRVICMGNALVDVLARVENDDVLTDLSLSEGAMQLVDDERFCTVRDAMTAYATEKATGGSAANTALAMAQLGARPGFVGSVGADDDGCFFAHSLQEHGVQTRLVSSERPTGVASTFISPDGQRTFATYLGAAAGLTADDLRPDWLEGYDCLYVEGYLVQNHALIDRAFDLAHAAGLEVGLDLASYNIVEADYDFFVHLAKKSDLIFANADEARVFTGKGPHEAVAELARTCRIAVVKNGKLGAIVQRGDEVVEVPAMEVARVVDTTAAGDFFAAGFLYGLAGGASLLRSAELGSLLAGHIIQHVGTALPEAEWREIRTAVQTL